MHNLLDFYKFYSVNHYIYKIDTLKTIIDNYERLKEDAFADIRYVREKDYILTLRADIRATYFQAIETLFEMIFALEPENGHFVDADIWLRLSTSDFKKNYRKINKIAKGETDFLDAKVAARKYSDGTQRKITLLEYVFFYFDTNKEMETIIKESSPAIKQALVLFAEEFSNREEYNAMKHGMRIFHSIEEFGFKLHSDENLSLKLDMSKSMTYIKQEKGAISLHTVPLDTERDVKMTYICSSLIRSIVITRRAKFFEGKIAEEIISVPTVEGVKEASKRSSEWASFIASQKQ